ncbi:laccase-like protein [Xylariaceae sp. FL1272]|nr:laccase-like protein [Xylariaceae sp. FL1272]
MPSFHQLAGLMTALLAGLSQSAPSTIQQLETRASTCNTATNRACWSDGYDINTDYEVDTPDGVTRTYDFTIEEFRDWEAPDGTVKEIAMLINGQFPGPTITGDWGDTLQITITNNLSINGTSIHWHGMRMLHSNLQDGVNGVTECPIPPAGGSKTYTFKLTQYGTTWYHSHFSAQYANGVFGAIVVNGPASANYDIDLGAYPINDFYLESADDIVAYTMANAAPPASDNIFFNGTNINLSGTDGEYSTISFTPEKTHLLRLYNPSAQHSYQVSIVGHNMTVIETDMVPVEPITVDNIFLAIGQRANVLINATATPGNYWMNVTIPSGLCGGSDNIYPAAIVHYTSVDEGTPTDQGTLPLNVGCRDSLSYVPVVSRSTDLDDFAQTDSNTFEIDAMASPTIVWTVNSSSINVAWDKPVVDYVMTGNTSYPTEENIVLIDQENVWTYWIMENLQNVPHPVHLHGHDFLVLGASADEAGTFTEADRDSLNVNNPTRRDVTMLPALGWLVLAFKADNPGAWLFHCHIAWHVSGGLALDFLEGASNPDAFITSAEQDEFNDNCAAWSTYWDNSGLVKTDSGLKVRELHFDS